MLPDFSFVLLAIGIAVPHKLSDRLASVHGIQCIQNWPIIYHHIKEIRIDTAAILSWKVWVDRTEAFIFHYRFNYHLT